MVARYSIQINKLLPLQKVVTNTCQLMCQCLDGNRVVRLCSFPLEKWGRNAGAETGESWGANRKEVADLAQRIQADVVEKFGIWLEPEPVIV